MSLALVCSIDSKKQSGKKPKTPIKLSRVRKSVGVKTKRKLSYQYRKRCCSNARCARRNIFVLLGFGVGCLSASSFVYRRDFYVVRIPCSLLSLIRRCYCFNRPSFCVTNTLKPPNEWTCSNLDYNLYFSTTTTTATNTSTTTTPCYCSSYYWTVLFCVVAHVLHKKFSLFLCLSASTSLAIRIKKGKWVK